MEGSCLSGYETRSWQILNHPLKVWRTIVVVKGDDIYSPDDMKNSKDTSITLKTVMDEQEKYCYYLHCSCADEMGKD